MNFKNIVHILKNFRKKYRLNFRDPRSQQEVWHIHISAFNVLSAFLAFVLVLFIAVASLIAYTPLLDLLPGQSANYTKESLIRNIIRLDSMEQEMLKWEVYRENMAMIMDGKTPVSVSASTLDTMDRQTKTIIFPSPMDTVLRQQMEGYGVYRIEKQPTSRVSNNTFEMLPPVNGIVTRRFDPPQSFYGTDVTVPGSQPVHSVLDGTVVMNVYSPDDGFIIQIQHAGNMISVYKNLTRMTKSENDRVKAGEIIGYIGSQDSDIVDETQLRSYLRFELWHDGSAIDPENYISFGS